MCLNLMNQKEEILPSKIRWDDQKADITLPSSSIVVTPQKPGGPVN